MRSTVRRGWVLKGLLYRAVVRVFHRRMPSGCPFQRLVQGDAVNVQWLRHADDGLLAALNRLAGVFDLLRCEVGGASEMLCPACGRPRSLPGCVRL
jgi:hypothetical protein